VKRQSTHSFVSGEQQIPSSIDELAQHLTFDRLVEEVASARSSEEQ